MKNLFLNKKGDDVLGIDFILDFENKIVWLESKDDDLKEENNILGQKLKKFEKIMG